ncbi:MAG: hypothetical protein Q7T06_06480 [Herminiimonas sp.]|nr:hypothetical protein [Herminiimonas sp.]
MRTWKTCRDGRWIRAAMVCPALRKLIFPDKERLRRTRQVRMQQDSTDHIFPPAYAVFRLTWWSVFFSVGKTKWARVPEFLIYSKIEGKTEAVLKLY